MHGSAWSMVLLSALLACAFSDEARIAGGSHELPAGDDAVIRVIAPGQATLIAQAPTTLRGLLRLEHNAQGVLIASVVPVSLSQRGNDDFRELGLVSGTREDRIIDFTTPAMGTPEERARFKVAGNDGDWNQVSIQWDGQLTVGHELDLATTSDDGSRVWIDRDGDGQLQVSEWGSNGWGDSQGATTRVVHHLQPGSYRMRVQWEDGGGSNCCRLLWNHRDLGTPTDGGWRVVPADAFAPSVDLTVSGPVTIACPVEGRGRLVLTDGARLATAPKEVDIDIDGRAGIAADLDLSARTLSVRAGATCSLGGHALTARAIGGAGTIALGGGTLTLPPGTYGIAVDGPGTLVLGAGVTRFARVDPRVQVRGVGYVLRTTDSCLASVPIAAPLGTVVPIADQIGEHTMLEVALTVPGGAPADLGIVAWRTERDGTWYQRVHPERLAPGHHRINFALGDDVALTPEGHAGRWGAAAAANSARVGIVLFASEPSSAQVDVDARLTAPIAVVTPSTQRLCDLELAGWDGTQAHASTGRRWTMRVRPTPMPDNPYDPDEFRLDLVVDEPDGSSRTIAGFAEEPVRRVDDGDRERFVLDGPLRFAVRFRPRLPGRHRLRLIAAWVGGSPLTVELGDLVVDGEPWDGIPRPDAQDPRFFSAGGRFIWPIGHNLNSTYDVRSRSSLGTTLTPDRGSFTRDALLERLIAAGGTGCETWLSAWNLGLEWSQDWPGYRGAGRYHPGHAWALDRFLDRAEAAGMHVNLSIYNHGMARENALAEAEWPFHPWRRANGGWMERPAELFRDERAFVAQRKLFRYLGARYGDSPALLGWKLWAEVNLAEADNDEVVAWHARAGRAMAEADGSGRGVTTHWCGDWNSADRRIAAQPEMGYLTIDAYHGEGTLIADLLAASTRDPLQPGQGLAGFGKPILVTEYGGSPLACAPARLAAEHAIGPWVGLVSGHGGSPMLWWFEWIDQQERFALYGAVKRFIDGEDLRSREAGCIAPTAVVAGETLWCRAWSRPGRMLGYVLDHAWGFAGGDGRRFDAGELVVGETVAPGELSLEWWDCDRGEIVERRQVSHPGGRLALPMPAFQRHLAFKLVRAVAP